MGSAILNGLLSSTRADPQSAKITRYIVSTKSDSSASRLRSTYAEDASRLDIAAGQNLAAMQQADIIMLACKPFLAAEILSEPGVAEALVGKFVISVMAGKTPDDIMEFIYKNNKEALENGTLAKPVIVRAMPNVAASLGKSVTIIEENAELSAERAEILSWVFERVGTVKYVASNLVDAGSIISGASMALMSVALDGILDGAVIEGYRRGEALEISAQVLEGMAGLLREGAHPAVLRENISSPRGCTIQGLFTLEKKGVRGTFAEAIVKGTEHLRK
ncbi:delta 1-pyrroline-5-carboxylate reductase [Aspergillus hancockii]|nr:delta 1-pyrroline-5-carboxylate reductase [Aspergillus hancockii]